MSDTKLGHLFNSSYKIRPATPSGALSVCLVQAVCLSVCVCFTCFSALSLSLHTRTPQSHSFFWFHNYIGRCEKSTWEE